MLEVAALEAGYGEIRALTGVTLSVREGELVTLVGANGAGKTTLLRTISGLLPTTGGSVVFRGDAIHKLPAVRRARLGIGHVPEGRQIFGPLTVRENLEMGAVATRLHGEPLADALASIYDLFPRLKERESQLGGTLSGGEQQMLAVGRAMMGHPQFLMLDEPSLGLAPRIVDAIFAALRRLHEEGTTILLVEQNAEAALAIADRGYVMDLGRVVHEGEASALLSSGQIRDIYFGTKRAQKESQWRRADLTTR
jgi:branched-chain amino acid transport system ATP-binding protein